MTYSPRPQHFGINIMGDERNSMVMLLNLFFSLKSRHLPGLAVGFNLKN